MEYYLVVFTIFQQPIHALNIIEKLHCIEKLQLFMHGHTCMNNCLINIPLSIKSISK